MPAIVQNNKMKEMGDGVTDSVKRVAKRGSFEKRIARLERKVKRAAKKKK